MVLGFSGCNRSIPLQVSPRRQGEIMPTMPVLRHVKELLI